MCVCVCVCVSYLHRGYCVLSRPSLVKVPKLSKTLPL